MYIHDDPSHPWHWTRTRQYLDPEMGKKKDWDEKLYSDLYHQFHSEGWVIFQSCSLKKSLKDVLEPVALFTATIDADRAMNAPFRQVKEIATDQDTLEFINFLHGGRRAFPYQTINFPKGTQQGLHSDLIHFDSQPRTLMTAAWVALENMNKNNGPLRFFPKSHRWGTWDFDEIGLHYKYETMNDPIQDQHHYSSELEKAMKRAGLNDTLASEMRKGQTFIWAAALVHGGSKQNDLSLSRLSQVTHYFFEGYEYIWQPRTSRSISGDINYIRLEKPPCKKQFLAMHFFSCVDGEIAKWRKEWKQEL